MIQTSHFRDEVRRWEVTCLRLPRLLCSGLRCSLHKYFGWGLEDDVYISSSRGCNLEAQYINEKDAMFSG